LRHYAGQFGMAEVDATYYGLPSGHMAHAWATRTPARFVFNVKAFRLFTGHAAPLRAPPADIRRELGASGDDADAPAPPGRPARAPPGGGVPGRASRPSPGRAAPPRARPAAIRREVGAAGDDADAPAPPGSPARSARTLYCGQVPAELRDELWRRFLVALEP